MTDELIAPCDLTEPERTITLKRGGGGFGPNGWYQFEETAQIVVPVEVIAAARAIMPNCTPGQAWFLHGVGWMKEALGVRR